MIKLHITEDSSNNRYSEYKYVSKMSTINGFSRDEYNEEQLRIIDNALQRGFDISYFGDPKRNNKYVMNSIYRALSVQPYDWFPDVDLSCFKDPRYDADQRKWLGLGLDALININTYADPNIPANKMKEIYEDLLNKKWEEDERQRQNNKKSSKKSNKINKPNNNISKLLDYMIHELNFEPYDIAEFCNISEDELYEQASAEDLIDLLNQSQALDGTTVIDWLLNVKGVDFWEFVEDLGLEVSENDELDDLDYESIIEDNISTEELIDYIIALI